MPATKRLRSKTSDPRQPAGKADTVPGVPHIHRAACGMLLESLSWMGYLMSRACLCGLHDGDIAVAGADIGNAGIDFSSVEAGDWLRAFAELWFGLTFSSAFSGIGSPVTGMHMVDCWIASVLGDDVLDGFIGGHWRDIRASRNYWAIERDRLARNELMSSPFKPQHCFNDVLDFVHPDYKKDFLHIVATWSFEALLQGLKSGMFISLEGTCKCCGMTLLLLATLLHAAGPPCVDHSTQGARQRNWGPAFAPTFAWFCLISHLAIKVVLHENVTGYTKDMMRFFLDWQYHFHLADMDSIEHGFVACRNRSITMLVLRDSLANISIPYPLFIGLCQRTCTYNWSGLLVASEEILRQEIHWSEQRRTSCCKAAIFDKLTKVERRVASENRFTKAMAHQDIQFLIAYREMFAHRFQDGRFTCSLTNNPVTHAQWMTGQNLLTHVAGGPLLWCQTEDLSESRWAAAQELLLAAGFCCLEEFNPLQVGSSFMYPNATRTRASMVRQAGNTMNTFVVTIAMVWAIAFVSFKEDEDLDAFLSMFL